MYVEPIQYELLKNEGVDVSADVGAVTECRR